MEGLWIIISKRPQYFRKSYKWQERLADTNSVLLRSSKCLWTLWGWSSSTVLKERGIWPSYTVNEGDDQNNITKDKKANTVSKHQNLETSESLMLVVLSRSDMEVVATMEKILKYRLKMLIHCTHLCVFPLETTGFGVLVCIDYIYHTLINASPRQKITWKCCEDFSIVKCVIRSALSPLRFIDSNTLWGTRAASYL